jgi:hypothetical protein
MYKSFVGSVVLSMSLLSGCAMTSVKHKPSNEPLFSLETVSVQTSQNMKELTQMKTSALRKSKTESAWRDFMFNLQSIPPNFSKKETFNFVGTVQKALEGVADLSKYKLYVVGNPPAQPLLVSISANNESLISVLRDINSQIGSKADIQLAPNARLIKLTFNEV